MKNLIIIVVLAFGFQSNIFGQLRCITNSNGNHDNDEPPGCTICDEAIIGNTAMKTAENFNFDFPCGEIENSQWFSLFANSQGQAGVKIILGDCQIGNGIEAAIYDKDFNLVSECKSHNQTNFPFWVSAENLIGNRLYYLMVDGNQNDNCFFTVETPIPPPTSNLSVGDVTSSNESILCPGMEVCFSISPVSKALAYEWESTPGHPIITGGGSMDTFVCIRVVAGSIGWVYVRPIDHCSIGDGISIPIVALSKISRHIDTIVCAGTPIQIRGNTFITEGEHLINIETTDPMICDTVVVINLKHINLFPSPLLDCKDSLGQLFLKWSEPSGATEYVVSVNRDSILTVSDNFVFLDGLTRGMELNLKVQPKGSCTYLPGEMNCIFGISKTKNYSFNNIISVFPNPTKGIVNIETDFEIEEIKIYDTAGRLLQTEKTTSFELKNRGSGIYFLKIKTDEGVGVKRVLVSSK